MAGALSGRSCAVARHRATAWLGQHVARRRLGQHGGCVVPQRGGGVRRGRGGGGPEPVSSFRLSSTRNLYRHPNSKWVSRDSKSASDRVPIRETYFWLPERHNLNMGILSPGNPFAERILFWVLLLEKMPNRY